MFEPTNQTAVVAAEASPDFETFFRAEHRTLFQALFLLTGDRAESEDVAQEALMRAFERWDRVRAMDSPEGYLYRTALNLHRSRVRKLAVRARHTFAPPGWTPDASDAVTTGLEVRRALASLPSGQREALVLVEWLGLDSDEAGKVLGIEGSSVRGRVHRGRATLRERLGDVDAD